MAGLFIYDYGGAVLILGFVLLIVAVALRSATPNRYIRGRLLVSTLLFAAQAVAAAVVARGAAAAETVHQLQAIEPLLVSLGLILLVVSIALNPWRVDRVSDRFPHILQDTLIVALFAVAATVFMREKVLTTTAVGAVVIGFALQDTLGNLFAGLAIQIEKPFRVGDWVNAGGRDGMVTEITWRATKLRTKTNNFVIVPNSTVSKDTITNYSQPTPETRVDVEIGASYDTPPNEVKAAILDAIRDEPLLAGSRRPEVLVADFAASAITYSIRVWTDDFGIDGLIRDRVRSAVYYAFRRRNISIPYPISVQLQRDLPPLPAAEPRSRVEAALAAAEIFAPLTGEQRAELAGAASTVLYASGETVVRQGDPGGSMFVLVSGEAVVRIDPGPREVARVTPGGYFGEMSLLTGDARTATVAAVVDSELAEITTEAFRRFVLAEPAVLERITTAVEIRREQLRQHAASAAEARAHDGAPAGSLLDRVRRFLRLAPLA